MSKQTGPKTIYRIRIIGSYPQATFDTLEEAIAGAKVDPFFKKNPKTIIEKIITERVWEISHEKH